MIESISAFLSSYFLASGYFALLALIPVIVLLYLLKLRRTRIVIPSTLLWTSSIEDLTANAPFQRLRRNLLMFLQIVILLFIIAALARPFFATQAATGRNLCLIIDRSASMKTREDGGTRLQLAQNAALEIVQGLSDSDRAMVIAFGKKTDVLCELTNNRWKLRDAVLGITARDTTTQIKDVMLIARSLAPDNRDLPAAVTDLKPIVFSDGNIADLEDLGTNAMSVEFVQVGSSSSNAGIVAFSVRNPAEGALEQQAFVVVHNEAAHPLHTTITLFHDEQVAGVSEIHVPAQSDAQAIMHVRGSTTGILKAELDHHDALDADNAAWLALQPAARISVLLVARDRSPAAYFLKRALSLDPRVDLSVTDPSNYAATGRHDLIVFDGWAPDKLPAACTAFFHAVPPVPGLRAAGAIPAPAVLAVDRDHVLMRLLNPHAVRIHEATKLELPDYGRTLLSASDGPLIADVSHDNHKIVLVAFDIGKSDWPLNLSFPLFVQNLLAWTPRMGPAQETSISTGRPLAVMPSDKADTAVVTLPDGTKQKVRTMPLRPVYFSDTYMSGVYRIRTGDHHTNHAVNLLDRKESSITPAASLQIGRGEVVATATSDMRQNQELWRWLLFAALGVLALEWWIYCRRAQV
jgi:hypothetical protein